MILCTENDKIFIKYKDKVKNRKVIFTIKQIFKDWWNKFLDAYPNLNIRNVVFLNVERMLKCQSWDLGYASKNLFHQSLNICLIVKIVFLFLTLASYLIKSLSFSVHIIIITSQYYFNTKENNHKVVGE